MNNTEYEWLVYFHRDGTLTYHPMFVSQSRTDWEFYALHRITDTTQWQFDNHLKKWSKTKC